MDRLNVDCLNRRSDFLTYKLDWLLPWKGSSRFIWNSADVSYEATWCHNQDHSFKSHTRFFIVWIPKIVLKLIWFQIWIYLPVEHSECEGVWPNKTEPGNGTTLCKLHFVST